MLDVIRRSGQELRCTPMDALTETQTPERFWVATSASSCAVGRWYGYARLQQSQKVGEQLSGMQLCKLGMSMSPKMPQGVNICSALADSTPAHDM